jgi:formylmethanofuran dehydrogenase subunit E
MVTGFAGHNRGKIYVKGVGYVAPPVPTSAPISDRRSVCKRCGTIEPDQRIIFASGKQLCTVCATLEERERFFVEGEST